MNKLFLKTAAILGALSVALGAFGAHSLKRVVTAEKLQLYETAVRYQFYHVFALLAVAILYKEFPAKTMLWAGRLFICGIVLFSGSLYALTFAPDNLKWLGAITPFGGAAFIAGWICLLIVLAKKV